MLAYTLECQPELTILNTVFIWFLEIPWVHWKTNGGVFISKYEYFFSVFSYDYQLLSSYYILKLC